jgi:tetratricopeptide (TPR) repeat protein
MKAFLAAGLLLVVISGAFGQAGHGTGRLVGIVVDENEDPIPMAKVVITLLEHEVLNGRLFFTPKIKRRDPAVFETMTDKKGRWYVNGLSSGKWEIRASRAGYVAMNSVRDVLQSPNNREVKLWLESVKEGFYSQDPAALEQANESFRQGDFEKARAEYTAYLAKEPEAVWVMMIIGDCWKKTGDSSKAMETYQEVAALTSADPARKDALSTALAKIGECYLDKGERERALDFLRRSAQASPGNGTVQAWLGELLFSMGNVVEAVCHLSLAVEIAPEKAFPQFRLGLGYLNIGDHEHARVCFLKVIDLDPASDLARQSREFLDDLKGKKTLSPRPD